MIQSLLLSLRGRLFVAFTFIIVLTVVLTGIIASFITTDRFEALTAEQGSYQASKIAPLLEATYAVNGGWDGLELLLQNQLLNSSAEVGVPKNDWYQIISDELQLERGSAAKLTNETIVTLAAERGVSLTQLEKAILQHEYSKLQAASSLSDIDQIILLANTIRTVQAFMNTFITTGEVTDTPVPPQELLADYLLSGQRLLVVDKEGRLVYDSGNSDSLEFVDGMVNHGVPIYDLATGEQVGTAIVATGTGFHNAQQERFLNGISNALVISGVIAGLAALIVAAVISSEVTAPVVALTDAARNLAHGKQSQPLYVDAANEVGQMSLTFNQMAQSLENQRALRRQLVNDLAHELGTPLSVIQQEMHSLRNGQQTAERAVARVQMELDLLRNLVNDLDLLTAEQTKLQLHTEPLELAFFTNRAVERWRPPAETNQINLSFVEPEQPLAHTQGDISRLIQVLGNLINNALRHTPPNGKIVVSCLQTTLEALDLDTTYIPAEAAAQEWLVTTIQDSGEGISTADIPHVFDRFYRTEETRARHNGRGLGLAIVKQIIDAHGGYVWVTSEEGKGSTFGFCLPIKQADNGENGNW